MNTFAGVVLGIQFTHPPSPTPLGEISRHIYYQMVLGVDAPVEGRLWWRRGKLAKPSAAEFCAFPANFAWSPARPQRASLLWNQFFRKSWHAGYLMINRANVPMLGNPRKSAGQAKWPGKKKVARKRLLGKDCSILYFSVSLWKSDHRLIFK